MTDRVYIVVVDDDSSVRKALGRLLRIAGMEVDTYSSAEKFLLSLDNRQPDCLILDIRMPEMTGPELRDQLVAMKLRIPIVFITAHGENGAAKRGPSGERADILKKPFDDEALLAAIRRSIRPEAA